MCAFRATAYSCSLRCFYHQDICDFGTVCTFSCDDGHELQGALSMECTLAGQWTSTPPTCTGTRMNSTVRCPLLEAPVNGAINCSDPELKYNSECSFTCNQGHSLHGYEVVICDRYGNWTAEQPVCQAVQCAPLSQPDGGYLNCSGENQTFNSTCTFGCYLGFLLLGSSDLTCGTDGVWSGPRPVCASNYHLFLAKVGLIILFCRGGHTFRGQ
uniref:Sushi domain-containing protein n=1 Tax=Myripristis murdjan TaxID=586833 RepID=A0A667YGA4_9TELE